MAKEKKMTDAQMQEGIISSWVLQKFNEARSNKLSRTQLDKACIDAYNGDTKVTKPDYASNHISNYIHATLETIRPIMTDNNPKFQALARNSEGKDKASKVQTALDYEWDRSKMSIMLPKALTTALTTGTAIIYLPWNKNKDKKGQVTPILVDPMNFFPDPMATTMEDADWIIYSTYKNVNIVKKLFPNKAEFLSGTGVSDPDLVSQKTTASVNNQILILECWCRDHTEVADGTDEYGNEKKKKKYPRGRVITVAPQPGIVLKDRQNPYKDGKFPFVLFKDYDVPFKFWGSGDVEQLLSPQFSLNELNNAVIDNAKLTANSPWLVEKNAGIPRNSLTNEHGLVIRHNPGTIVRRLEIPTMPNYIQAKIDEMKNDIESIAGIHNSTRGQAGDSVVAAQAILALQEAGQARIRLKVRIMEQSLAQLANMWYARMQQFWKSDRIVSMSDINGKLTQDTITPQDLTADFDIIITAGSTMPVNRNAMLDLMIRLGQTTAEDGLPMVDREAIMEFVPINNKQDVLARMQQRAEGQLNQEAEAMEQQLNQMVEMVTALTKQVEDLTAEHDKLKQKESDAKLMRRGYEQGQSDQGLTDDDINGIIEDEKTIPDEILMEIETLSDEEIQQLLSVFPELDKIIASNS
jgi:hypothetical protein